MNQALKTGQIPADLLVGNTNATNNHNATQENDGPADMEQVIFALTRHMFSFDYVHRLPSHFLQVNVGHALLITGQRINL